MGVEGSFGAAGAAAAGATSSQAAAGGVGPTSAADRSTSGTPTGSSSFTGPSAESPAALAAHGANGGSALDVIPSSSSSLGRSLSASSASRLHFPVHPASQALPNQAFQTPSQVASILSLPPALLLNLARTTSPAEQQAIAQKAQATSYLSAMSLPPPSPTELTGSLLGDSNASNGLAAPTSVAVTSIGDHPAIPILLGQAFCPPTPGIVVSANDSSKGFEPIYASVQDWSYAAARDQVGQKLATSSGGASTSTGPGGRPSLPKSHSFNEREVTTIAEQMARWALKEQEKQVQQQVIYSKETAVFLAAQAAARHAVVNAATTAVSSAAAASQSGPHAQLPAGMSQADVHAASVVVSGGPEGGLAVESAVQGMDLSSYAESYKRQLDALASGYFAQLHREALKRIVNASETPPAATGASDSGVFPNPSSGPTSRTGSPAAPLPPDSSTLPSHTLPSLSSKTGRPQAEAMHVQAAAAAAVAANVMAANEMASVAGSALQDMGVVVGELVPERAAGGLQSLEVRADAIAVSGSAGLLANGLAATSLGSPSRTAPPPPAASAASTKVPAPPAPAIGSTSQPPDVTALLTDATATQACTPEKRDYLLSYAHTLYTKDASSPELLPLLHTLEQIHEDHLPTLLLMSCVYYTRGELESSFYYNRKLLSKDPNYVSRRGRFRRRRGEGELTTPCALAGRGDEQHRHDVKGDGQVARRRDVVVQSDTLATDVSTCLAFALEAQADPHPPSHSYWDATENLLGVLCNPSTSVSAAAAPLAASDPPPTTPRYQEALALCEYVESQIFADSSSQATARSTHTPTAAASGPFVHPVAHLERPRCLPAVVPINHVHRLQNLFYAKGNLRMALGDAAGAQDEYEKAVEVAMSLPMWVKEQATGFQYPMQGLRTRDLVMVAIVLGKVLAAYAQGGTSEQEKGAMVEMVRQLGVGDDRGKLAFERMFKVVREGGDEYVQRLMAMGGGVLPTVLLQPDHLAQLPAMLFPETHGALPALFDPSAASPSTSPLGHPATAAHAEMDPARKSAITSTNQTTSTMLLTLAKIFQDAAGATSSSRLTLGGIPASQSLLLPLYYVALALYPSPSTCNNLGILLSTMNATTLVNAGHGHPPVLLSGQVSPPSGSTPSSR